MTPTNTEQLYQERLRRYVAAMRNEQPDRVPIRPFVAEQVPVLTVDTFEGSESLPR